MNPYIGIVKGKPGWIQIFEQEGLSYKTFQPPDNPAVLVVDDITSRNAILEYLAEGGHIITSTEIVGKLLGEHMQDVKIDYIVPDASEVFHNSGIIDVYERGHVRKKEGFGTTDNDFPAVFTFQYRKGHGICFPFDVSALLLKNVSQMKYFYAKQGRFPAEYVCSVSKGEVRKLAINSIRYLFRKKGIHYIHKWYYPDGKDNAFTFRVDTDDSGFAEITNTFKIAEKNSLSFTFFVEVKCLQNALHKLKDLKNQEIAVHCFEHRIFRKTEKNQENFLRARQLLHKTGITTTGIAVPYGLWDNSLGALIESSGFAYSTEFSYAYDDFPTHPCVNTKHSPVLQIPVHPICTGTLLYAKNNISEIKQYFTDIINEKCVSGESLFLYGHSREISRYPSILQHIINEITTRKNIWAGTYGDFYKWWKEREQTKLEITSERNLLKIKTKETNSHLHLHIITAEGKHALIPLQSEIDLNKITFSQMPQPEPFDRKRLSIKQGSLKLKFKEIENWIKR
ncbi:MAG: hypothetical protein E3J78_00825 [Candidatus Cloacimonadota bacterium]|nr:MAG: hypothetical protein E3J78_00825 [Candidatus Cloacimonadota bacterium]